MSQREVQSDMPATGVAVRISDDGLTARVVVEPSTPPVSAEALRQALKVAGVQLTPEVQARLDACTPNGIFTGTTGDLLAEGVPPVDDIPAAFIPAQPMDGGQRPDGTVDHYSRAGMWVVGVEQVVGQAVAYQKGEDGRDVRGRAIPRRAALRNQVTAGANVRLEADGKTLRAVVAGVVHVDGLRIWIEPRLAVPGDVDFSTGHIRFAGDVTIAGTVLDLFKVEATGDVIVQKAVEAADVRAGRDLLVHGGIMGKEKGRCQAGGNVRARHISNAAIEAGGAVTAQREVSNSHIVCAGKLTVEGGPLLGGESRAGGGVKCVVLGSPSAVKTIIEVGITPEVRTLAGKLPHLLNEQKQSAALRKQLADLMKHPEKLTAPQREKITEMMFEFDEKERKLQSQLAEGRERLAAMDAAGGGDVEVSASLYPGVTIRFMGIETEINKELQGPLKILPGTTPDGRRVVLKNMTTGSLYLLDTRACIDEKLDALRQFLQAQA